MSRCFPFPPPGYEKKDRTNDVDFLKKEKQKEKRHKKEKDKEKRENKEKKEKDRSDGKHKDKKDKKEKHKDKKKEKNRDKEKDRNNNLEEKKFPGHPEGQNGEKTLDEKKLPGNSEGHSGEKFITKGKDRDNNLEEKKFPGHPEGQNGEKTLDEKKLPGNSEGHSGEKFITKGKDRDKDRSSLSSEKKLGRQFLGYNGEKISQNSRLDANFRDAKFVQELGRRVRDEGTGAGNRLVENIMCTEKKRDERMIQLVAKTANALAEVKEKNKRSDDRKFDVQGIRDERSAGARAGNRLVEKFTGSEQKRDEGMICLVAKTTNALAEEKEKNKRSDDRKFDVQGIRDEGRSGGNAMVQKIAGAVNARVEGIPRQVESNTERRDEGREKTKEKESENKIRDKRKDKDREKKSHGKDKDRGDKEEKKRKKKEEKAKVKVKGQHRNLEADNLEGSNKDDHVGTFNLKASDSSEGNKGAVEENHRKRKDCEKNGFLHANDLKPKKLLRTSSLLTDNGRSLDSCRDPIPLTSGSHGAGNGLKMDAKEHKLNGTREAQLLFVASAQVSQIDEVSTKSPHPDSNYLSQVLSVPEMEEWSDVDDQSWLFQSNESQSKKSKLGFSEIDEAPQVWAEALQIESADVCALPYVIPY